jgi:hypothetical protein
MVLFSGLSSINSFGTWTWDGVDWMQANPATQPSARFYSAAAYDPLTAGVLLFGGNDGSGGQDDTWNWNGTNWTQLRTTRTPAPRDSQGMAYDEIIKRVVLFGGIGRSMIYGDTWVFGGNR